MRCWVGIVGLCLGSLAAHAQPLDDAQKRRVHLPYVRAATDCIAQAALQNEAAALAAQQNRGPDLAAAVQTPCLDALRQMVSVHDSLYGTGTGIAFYRGPYLQDLPRAVLTRIQPELTRRMAEAERRETERRAELARQEAQTKQVEEERRKLIGESIDEHHACIKQALVALVPYSSDSAESVAIAIMAKCADHETKRARLAATLFGVPTDQVKSVVAEDVERMRKSVITEIVTFRAERAKSGLGLEPSTSPASPPVPAGKLY